MSDTTENAAASAADDEPRPLGPGERRLRLPHRHYEGLIREQIAAWATGTPPQSTAEVMCFAEPDQPANGLLRDYLRKCGLKPADLDAALRREQAVRELGRWPADPGDYVGLLAGLRGLAVRANGVIERDERPYIDIERKDGEIVRSYFDADTECEEMRAHAEHWFRHAPTLSEFALDARTTSDRLRLGFRRDALNDAVQAWHKRAKHGRLEAIKGDVLWRALTRERAAAEEALLRACRAYNDDARQPAEYFAAVLRKLLWQVKRKLARVPVTDHAMPILLGAQRGGKSTLVRRILAPVAELAAPCDFGMICDPRNIDLWGNHVLFLDEMSYATKADIDVVKNVVTAETLTRKPLYANGFDVVRQCATLVGAANKSDLADLLRDSTGMRRFLAVHVRAEPDWAAAESTDWAAVWRAVDHEAEDPMLAFADMARERQEAARERTNT
ncbi:MAG: hypothetical protein ICV73_18715, partial [Acetobacteraceae bacterium]|nr:hypothetical protein [Acetobacteraceae bacterium]